MLSARIPATRLLLVLSLALVPAAFGQGIPPVEGRDGSHTPTMGAVAQQAFLQASNPGGDDLFGGSVAVSGDTLIVGANGEWSNATGVDGDQSDNSLESAGAAYVFTRSGTDWIQEAYLKASDTDAFDYFGGSVAVWGDTAVVGASGEASNATGTNGNGSDNSTPRAGAAYVYVRSGTSWVQQAYLKASNTDLDQRFGLSVAIYDDTIVIGAYGEGSSATGVNGDENDDSAPGAGAAYVFVRNGSTWSQQAYLKASATDPDDHFGARVAISEDTIVVGAPFEDSNATGVNGDSSNNGRNNSGAVYVFVRHGSSWSQQAYLKASNTGAGDRFGSSVSVSGDTVLIGAVQEDSDAEGVNGDSNNNGRFNSGAGFVFVRDGTTWTQEAYLKASNPGESDWFGSATAVSGDTAVVATYLEDSAATGVDGDQSDNSASHSGAAYLFVRHQAHWRQAAYLKASDTQEYDNFGASVTVWGDSVVIGAPYKIFGAAYVFDVGTTNDAIGASYCGPGVPNSTGAPGTIVAVGSDNADDEEIGLWAHDLPPGNVCMFITSMNQALIPNPGGSCGNLCLSGPGLARYRRGAQIIDAAGQAFMQIDPFLVRTSPPRPILNGQTWSFQAWHRDAGAQPACGDNFTDATSVTFSP